MNMVHTGHSAHYIQYLPSSSPLHATTTYTAVLREPCMLCYSVYEVSIILSTLTQNCVYSCVNSEKPFLLHEKRGLAILVTCDYQGTAITPLNATNHDANEMRRTFEQFQYDIHQLQNGAATEYNITLLLKQASHYLSQYSGSKENSDGSPKVIVFAFSGHGTSCGYDDDQIITYDNQNLFLKEQIRLPLVKHSAVAVIPKLFFMDACRGGAQLRQKMLEKGNTNVETNYRIDYATVPNHTAGAGIYESIWMPVLAKLLREEDRELSVVIEMVTGKVRQRQAPQQPESLNRLRLEKPLKLYYNRECIIIFLVVTCIIIWEHFCIIYHKYRKNQHEND